MCFTLAGISPSSIGNTSSKFKTYPFSPNLNVKYMSCHFPAKTTTWSHSDVDICIVIHPSIHPSPDLPTTPKRQDSSGVKPWLIEITCVHVFMSSLERKKHPWWSDDNICISHVYISIHTQIYVCYIYIYIRQKFSFSGILILQWYLLQPICIPFHRTSCRIPHLSVFKNPKNPLVPLWGSFFVHASHGRRPAPKVAADNLPRGQNMSKLAKTGSIHDMGVSKNMGYPKMHGL